ncbi:MAG: putative DNA binding domain-containing protein [Myxococcales bacterium]|nr:putative DNA binding domain-containing protein [Myxococcales bacterium]
MTHTDLDLTELATRESEQVEWKENVASVEDVVQTVVAFANDLANLGGGYVICGAREVKDEHGFQRLEQLGMTAARCREVEERTLALCRSHVDPPLVPLASELTTADPSRRMLVFVVPRSQRAHSYRQKTDTGKYYIRVGRQTVEARNGLLRELLVRKGDIEPWDYQPCKTATVADIDLIALRDAMQRMGVFDPARGLEPFLSDVTRLHALTPSLCVRSPLSPSTPNTTDAFCPRNFTILLFGRDVQRHVPGAYAIFSIYPGTDRSEPWAERHEVVGNLLEQERQLRELLNTHAYILFDKQNASTPNVVKYPQKALKEAMINALAHRDYAQHDPLRITVFADRIEIVSPGSLPLGIKVADFRAGRVTAKWRNQSLAWFFNRLQLAQAEGQGISTILREMKNEGCPQPSFDANEDRVTCVLPAHPRHALMRDLQRVEQALVLGNATAAQKQVRDLLDRDPFNYRTVQLFCEVQRYAKNLLPVLEFVRAHQSDLARFNAACQVALAEALTSLSTTQDSEAMSLARQLISLASAGKFELTEVRRLILAMFELGQEQEVLTFIDRAMNERMDWKTNPALLQLRGRALLQLAKRCSQNARNNSSLSARLRGRAWDECRRYLAEAEHDLREALAHGPDPIVLDHIRTGLDFVQTLKGFAEKPRAKPR